MPSMPLMAPFQGLYLQRGITTTSWSKVPAMKGMQAEQEEESDSNHDVRGHHPVETKYLHDVAQTMPNVFSMPLCQ